MDLNRRQPRVDPSRFSMVPRADIPRSTFVTSHNLKTTFQTGYLIPILVDEVLPGDVHKGEVNIFARLATPLFPIMDDMTLETFFFFVANRLVWDNWRKMMGERANPTDSISYIIPIVNSSAGGFAINSVHDYMGLPTVGQVTAGQTVSVNALPLRGYYFIWNEWFRDQNLQTTLYYATGDNTQGEGDFVKQRRNKKHDYFTSALPWPIKGGVEVTIPMTGNAPVSGLGIDVNRTPTAGNPATTMQTAPLNTATGWAAYYDPNDNNTLYVRAAQNVAGSSPSIFADLSQVSGQTINALRLAFQTQRLLERDARSGTRYTELLQSHFGVTPEDVRLQRPEYIGGGAKLRSDTGDSSD